MDQFGSGMFVFEIVVNQSDKSCFSMCVTNSGPRINFDLSRCQLSQGSVQKYMHANTFKHEHSRLIALLNATRLHLKHILPCRSSLNYHSNSEEKRLKRNRTSPKTILLSRLKYKVIISLAAVLLTQATTKKYNILLVAKVCLNMDALWLCYLLVHCCF